MVAIATALVIPGCTAAGRETLHVFAAASLTEVFPRVDDDPRYQFAGSDELALQIREGAQADVYAAASPKYPLELFDDDIVARPVVFATNELVLIVPADNPAGIVSVDDLRQENVKLVIGGEGVPVGDYTRTVLDNLDALAVLDRVVSEEQAVKGIVGKVRLGEADAGFVYATDVRPVEDEVLFVTLPEDAQPIVEYAVAVVAGSEHATRAREFVDLLLGAAGQDLLQEAGFGTP